MGTFAVLAIFPISIYVGLFLYIDAMVRDLKANARLMDVVWTERPAHDQFRSTKVHTVLVEAVSIHMDAIE